jgi:hypothetical protein
MGTRRRRVLWQSKRQLQRSSKRVCAHLVHEWRELMDANESWIDENQARGKNEFNVGLLHFYNFANENSPR